MTFLRDLMRGRRAAAIAGIAVVAAAGAGVAGAASSSSGPTPAPKPLASAVHDAITAPAVAGVSADIKFTNSLVSSSALTQGNSSPLLTGATGRAWIAGGGKFRLELQSSQGDAQIVSDGKTITVYDATSNTLYTAALPQDKSSSDSSKPDTPPTLADVQKAISRLAESANVSAAQPTNVAGQEAYQVSVSPKHDGGLLGAATLAWDAAKGVPLRIAVTAQGSDAPVLALEATHISYGDVPASDLAAPNPPNAKHVTVDVPAQGSGDHAKGRDVQGLDAVKAKLPFALVAPDQIAGLPRKQVRLVSGGDSPKAVVIYGQGLGAIAVLESQSTGSDAAPAPKSGDHGGSGMGQLPTVAINGATGHELPTALGTLLTWQRDGVSYTLVGSLPSDAARAAATDLK